MFLFLQDSTQYIIKHPTQAKIYFLQPKLTALPENKNEQKRIWLSTKGHFVFKAYFTRLW